MDSSLEAEISSIIDNPQPPNNLVSLNLARSQRQWMSSGPTLGKYKWQRGTMKIELTDIKRWVSHAIAAPFGIAAGTYLVANLGGSGQWLFWRDWPAMFSAATVGTLVYVGFASLCELVIKGLSVIYRAGYKAGQASGRAEIQTAALKKGREEGKKIALTTAWRVAAIDAEKQVVRLAASDLDINLPAVLGQPYMTARLEVVSPWDALWKQLADGSAELRRRLDVQTANDEMDKMLRKAAGVAVSDFRKQVERFCEADDSRQQQLDNRA